MTGSKAKKPVPSPYFAGVVAYEVPPIPAPTDLNLSANEGQGLPAELLDELKALGPDLTGRYYKADELERILADEFGVEPERVLVTNGADDGIDRICRAFLVPEKEVVIPTPTFEIFDSFSRRTGGRPRFVLWGDGAFPTADVTAACNDDTGMVVIISPNNPTGLIASAEDLRAVAEAAPQAVIALDMAYAEFADEDLSQAALALPNVVMLRTFSKAWGMAGIRVGFAIGDAEIIGALRVAGAPFACSSMSLKLAERWRISGRETMRETVRIVKNERRELSELLQSHGCRTLDGQGNFVFMRNADPIWLRDAVAGFGVAIRLIVDEDGFKGGLRISCPGDDGQFARLTHALESVLDPQALLFDMDGVLADVSESYRVAIAETVAGYGVEVSDAEIAAAKAEPGANDDWTVCQRLLERNGIRVGLDEVTKRFEAIYQGSAEAPGLWSREKLIPRRDWLARMAETRPLAVVTGRPKGDARRFLEQTGSKDLFKAVITREDAAMKPDPAPVWLAMKKLGVERAWMIGDAPDDIRAARAAGVLPLGVTISGAGKKETAAALYAAGAGRVFDEIERIEEVLP